MPELITRMKPVAGGQGLQRWWKPVCLAVLCCLYFSAYGFSQQCTTVASVQNSAILANNTAAGGHVLKHVTGTANPPTSQRNATMFSDAGQYNTIWNSYVASGSTVNCPNGRANGTRVSEQVAVADLTDDDTLDVCQCTANVDAQGSCRLGYENYSETLTFVFKVVNNQWILLTAYPLYGDPTTNVCVGAAPAPAPATAKKKS